MTETSFDKAQDLLKSLTGYDVDQNVTIDGKPTMYTFKFLVDVYPFRNNKHWHFTAGFYLGNKKIAKAVNAIEESTTMVSVGILETMWIWNDYLLPYLVLDIKKYKTISIAIQYLKGGYGTIDMGAMMGVLVLSIIPIIAFYLACQKYIIEGVVAGAVKG